jgi:hypothetical protein
MKRPHSVIELQMLIALLVCLGGAAACCGAIAYLLAQL